MKKGSAVWVFGCFALFGMFYLAGSAHAEQKETRLRYANFFPPTHKIAALADEWCKEVEKRTEGRVKITYFPGGILSPSNQSYDAAVKGIADISMTSQQWFAGRFPLTEVVQLPLGEKSAEQATKLINAWYSKFHPKEYDDVKVMYMFSSPPGHFMTLKPLSSINDLNGLRIRAAGDSTKIVSAMGAVPVAIPIADAYDSLQRGICEGVIMSADTLKSFRWGDSIRGIQINRGTLYPNALCVVMNIDKWKSLSPDIQTIIEQVNGEWIAKTGQAMDLTEKEGLDFGISQGMKVSTISDEEVLISIEKMKPLLETYVKNMKALGLPGEESLKFCIDYLKENPS